MVGIFITMENIEIWKKVPELNDYEVSNFGRVKSYKKNKVKILHNHIDKSGYYTVSLNNKTTKVHKLVAMAFLNHTPCGMKLVINHKDMNKLNNNVNNLEIVTQRQNASFIRKNKTSKYIGVYWSNERKKWASYIYINKKTYFLGRFESEKEASKVYKKKLKEMSQDGKTSVLVNPKNFEKKLNDNYKFVKE